MNKRIISVLVLALMLCSLSGCSFSSLFTPIEKLIRPPKLYGENSELQVAFEQYVGPNIVLKSAASGNYRSAFVLFDIDGNGSNEALVFYSADINQSAVKIQVMEKKNGKWTGIGNLLGSGSEVYSVDFVDMNSDGCYEIIVGWCLYENATDKIFTIYGCNGNPKNIKSLCTESFTYLMPIDFDNDGMTEIFYIMLDTTSQIRQSNARLLKLQDDEMIATVSEVKLDASVSGYSDVKVESLSEKSPTRIYLDAVKGETQMITDVVYYDSTTKTMVAPLLDKETQSNLKTWRSIKLSSRDINSDGVIEIPMQTTMHAGETVLTDSESPTALYITEWCQLVGNNLTTVLNSYVDTINGYILTIRDELYGNITMTNNVSERELTVYGLSKYSKRKTDELFVLKVVDSDDWHRNKDKLYSDYVELMSLSSGTMIYKTTEFCADYGITSETLGRYVMPLE